MYSVKEIFYTLQGEGAQSGRAAVFLRFAGCNLWTGREQDRLSAVCRFCDTDFIGTNGPGGGKFADAAELAGAVTAEWRSGAGSAAGAQPYVVCTGGEPLLQLDAPLIDALHAKRFEIAIETNGTLEAPPGIDWICVSPKGSSTLVQRSGDELKFVYPQEDATPDGLETLDFRHFFIQPMDSPAIAANIEASAAYCLKHPRWRLSLQMHKLAGIP
jgi:7-carboxy-7-deazaguanine synthase (Cx14CxxC type)